MPRVSKAQKARENNLKKARKDTVEEVPDEDDFGQLPEDNFQQNTESSSHLHPGVGEHFQSDDDSWDFDLGNELPDLECEDIPEQDLDLDEEIVTAPEITDENELEAFSQFLHDAQVAAQKAERAQNAQQKRRRHYKGNAPRTKHHHKKIGKDLAQKGFLGLCDFIAKKKEEKLKHTDVVSSTDVSTVASANVSAVSSADVSAVPSAEVSAAQSPANSDSESDSESQSGSSADEPETSAAAQIPDCMDPVNLAHVHLKELLEAIQDGSQILDAAPKTATDHALNQLSHKDFASLCCAAASLSVKSKDKKLDVFFRARIIAMAATLNLYLDSQLSYGWREASMIVSKSQGHGPYRARSIRNWIHAFLTSKKLPLHRYGQYHSSILNDEDFSDAIKLHLQNVSGKDGHFTAQTLVDFVATPEIQEMLEQADVRKCSISVWTARRWLKRLDW
ncbi:hypothetical protein C8R45DRAFT_926645 [Mycena sanguinolenta]|nr:hypothetical protein C8R45DRAFT_926645 [Mycena sanguinolenta]